MTAETSPSLLVLLLAGLPAAGVPASWAADVTPDEARAITEEAYVDGYPLPTGAEPDRRAAAVRAGERKKVEVTPFRFVAACEEGASAGHRLAPGGPREE